VLTALIQSYLLYPRKLGSPAITFADIDGNYHTLVRFQSYETGLESDDGRLKDMMTDAAKRATMVRNLDPLDIRSHLTGSSVIEENF